MTAKALHTADKNAPLWEGVDAAKKKDKASRAKRRLNQEASDAMTVAMLQSSDPKGEIESWLKRIAGHLTR